jgi:hypothetical protein
MIYIASDIESLSSSLIHLIGVVADLQGQVRKLTAHVQQVHNGQEAGQTPFQPLKPMPTSHGNLLNGWIDSNVAGSPHRPGLLSLAGTTTRIKQRFCGPTSPDYSLNAAQIKLLQGLHLSTKSKGQKLPSLDETYSDSENAPRENNSKKSQVSQRSPSPHVQRNLTQLHSLLKPREILNFLRIYEDVVGSLYPILDTKVLTEQVESWFTWMDIKDAQKAPIPLFDKDDVTILYLSLSTALVADPGQHFGIDRTLIRHIQDMVDATLGSPDVSIKGVVIALMMVCTTFLQHHANFLLTNSTQGFYHFFTDELRMAWRMCGLAGNMALELGLHSIDCLQHFFKLECQRAQIMTIVSSIVVLDRQWSASSGLPTHFNDAHFDLSLTSSVSTRYQDRPQVLFANSSDADKRALLI